MLYQNMSDNGTSSPIHDQIQILMNEYNDWGKLLAPAPLTIGILGQLIIMANQKLDVPLNVYNPDRVYHHIKYPKSFRTTLLQISQQGHQALLNAHTKMDAIRMKNRAVPGDIKDAIKYLVSKNTRLIELRLPATLEKISDAAKKSQDLSNEVVQEFQQVHDLISETVEAVTYMESNKEKDLDDVEHTLNITHDAKRFSENETLIMVEKAEKMEKMLERLVDRKNNMKIKTTYGGTSFTINLAKDWVKEIGQDLYKRERGFLHDTNQTWTYTYYQEFVKSNPCAQKNSQPLLDLLIVFGNYRKNYKRWQNSYRDQLPFGGGENLINDMELELRRFVKCAEMEDLITKVKELVDKLKIRNVFLKLKTTERPYAKEIEEIVILINDLRADGNNVSQKYDKKVDVKTRSAWDIYGESKRHQLSQLDAMSETAENIIKLNNQLMESRSQKTKQILDRLQNLDVTKSEIKHVIDALREGLLELGNLKNEWTNLIMFFEKIKLFVETASRYSDALVEIVQTLSRNPKDLSILLDDLRSEIEKSNEAVLLVHGVAENYVNVSDRYIMKRLSSLNRMISMRSGGDVTGEKLENEKKLLLKHAQDDSKGIEEFFNSHRENLIATLHGRHQEIRREYNQLFDCMANGHINLSDGYS